MKQNNLFFVLNKIKTLHYVKILLIYYLNNKFFDDYTLQRNLDIAQFHYNNYFHTRRT